jgi:hypothetical protein
MFPIRQRLQTMFVLFVLAGLVGPQQAWAAPAPDPPSDSKSVGPISFPDGVTDAERRTAFVSSPKGGIQAIRLEDGKALWTNDDVAARPWLVAGSRLVSRGERIVVLDLGNGKVLRRCDAPTYPKVEVPDRCTVSFNLWNAHVAGDVLEAKWYAVAAIDRSKGRPFNFPGWTGFNKAAPLGTMKVNLATGRCEVQIDAKPADVSAGLIPEAAKPEQRRPAGLSEKLTAVWNEYHKDQQGRITVLGGRLVGVSLTLEKAGQEYSKKVDLHAWDLKTGAAAEPVELVKDKALTIANVMLTGDRRHAGVQFSTSALTLYSLANGKAVARDVKGVSSPTEAFVDDMRLYSVEPAGARGGRTLRALDLKSGKSVWEHAVQPRSTIPLPP